ncbi:MAG TPA: hypothetical protein VNZ52_15120 [Candidatus Thermoplasmatota archaeon]|nr:hypothetical protein [Candidatus Thermoplasmatota archaeon]
MAKDTGEPDRMIAYPSGMRIIAAVLLFIGASNLWISLRVFTTGIADGNNLEIFRGLFLTAFAAALAATAVGLFWFKEWARFTGLWLMGLAAGVAVLGIISAPTGGNLLMGLLVLAAALSVLRYLTRPHVKDYFALQR